MPVEVPSPADVKPLPMSARMYLRDNYGKDDSDLNKNVAKLGKELSADVIFHLNWSDAWEKLGTAFKDDPQAFAKDLIAAGNDLVVSLLSVIDSNEAWGISLLSHLEKAGKAHLDLYVKIDSSAKTAKPAWNPIESTISLRLPLYTDTTHLYYQKGCLRESIPNIFNADFDQDDSPSSSASAARPSPASAPSGGNAKSLKLSDDGYGPPAEPERFPPLSTIPQPSMLSKESAPYWVTIKQSEVLMITGTHEPTVDLLAEYIEKWSNVTNRETSLVVERIKSPFGPGNVGMFVSRRTKSTPSANEVLPLQLLQGRLGYSVVKTNGQTWVLKRTTPFF